MNVNLAKKGLKVKTMHGYKKPKDKWDKKKSGSKGNNSEYESKSFYDEVKKPKKSKKQFSNGYYEEDNEKFGYEEDWQ